MSLFISPCLVTYKRSHCRFTSRLPSQEVLEELFDGIGEDGFGVDLDGFDFVATMAETHDDAVVSLGRDGELARQGFFLDDEGMVARRGERVGQLAENVFMVVMNLTGFAVKEFRGADDFAAERGPNGLMAEADTQDGKLSDEPLHHPDGNARLLRWTRTRDNHDTFRT